MRTLRLSGVSSVQMSILSSNILAKLRHVGYSCMWASCACMVLHKRPCHWVVRLQRLQYLHLWLLRCKSMYLWASHGRMSCVYDDNPVARIRTSPTWPCIRHKTTQTHQSTHQQVNHHRQQASIQKVFLICVSLMQHMKVSATSLGGLLSNVGLPTWTWASTSRRACWLPSHCWGVRAGSPRGAAGAPHTRGRACLGLGPAPPGWHPAGWCPGAPGQ